MTLEAQHGLCMEAVWPRLFWYYDPNFLIEDDCGRSAIEHFLVPDFAWDIQVAKGSDLPHSVPHLLQEVIPLTLHSPYNPSSLQPPLQIPPRGPNHAVVHQERILPECFDLLCESELLPQKTTGSFPGNNFIQVQVISSATQQDLTLNSRALTSKT